MSFSFKHTKLDGFILDAYFENSFQKINLEEIKTRYSLLVFYPLDFTFVCPTEISKFSELSSIFGDLDTTVLFISNDSVHSHKAWSQGDLGDLKFPMLSDKINSLSRHLNVYDEEEGHVMRSCIIYDNVDKKIKYYGINDDSIGRSTDELIRLIEAIIWNKNNKNVCPVNFKINK